MSCCNTYNLGCWNYCGSVSFGIAEETGSYTGVFTSGNTVVSQTVVIQDGDPFIFDLSLLNENAEYTLRVYFNGELLDIEVDGLLYDKFTLKTQFYGQTSTATPTSCTAMCEEIYDPTNVRADVFDYNNLHTTAVGDGVTITGTGTTADPFVSVGGGGGAPTIQDITYAALYALYSGVTLVPLQYYRITDFATIYDQSISDVTKTAAGEVLIVQASDTDKLFPNAFSESFPKDTIHYDITYTQTLTNAAPAKGKIIYRADESGNSADFDWRKILTFVVADSSEKLMFEDASVFSAVKLQNQSSIISTPYSTGLEFPNNYFNGGYVINVSNAVVVNNNITGGLQFISNCVIVNTTVSAGGMSKIMDANLFECNFGGSIDRLFGGYALFTTITGQSQYLMDASFMSTNIGGDARGISNVNFTNTTTDCNINTINGISVYELNVGFDSCTITTTTPGISFGNITLESKVGGKTITEALYPELFEMYYHKTIYRKPDGTVWYRFLDNTNTWVFTQIV